MHICRLQLCVESLVSNPFSHLVQIRQKVFWIESAVGVDDKTRREESV